MITFSFSLVSVLSIEISDSYPSETHHRSFTNYYLVITAQVHYINVIYFRVEKLSPDGDAAAAESVRSNGHQVDVITAHV